MMRTLFAVLMFALFQQDAAVRDLLQKLEDDRVETREQAQKGLAALGEAALPALREVAESAQSSGELKLRAAATIREIELNAKAAKVYREPARVTLKASDKPLRAVLDDLSRQAGVAIDSSSVNEKTTLTLDAADVPLMEAMDLICRGQAERNWEWKDDGSLRLARERHVGYPASHSGPFRVRVQSMNADRSNDFKARTVSVTIVLQAEWDRRLKPSKIVDLEVSKATDDQGTLLEVTPVDAGTFFRGGPGVQIRVGGGFLQDAAENSRTFAFRGLQPTATSVSIEGTARFTFPLDQREIKVEKPGTSENKDLGDTMVRLTRSGTPENWTISFHKPVSSTTPGWGKTIGQRFDPDSFVVVDQDGAEFSANLRTVGRGRQFQDANDAGIWYQGVVQRNTAKTIKEVKFRFVDQTLIKSAPFKFTTLALP
jgi:hypothetical protein